MIRAIRDCLRQDIDEVLIDAQDAHDKATEREGPLVPNRIGQPVDHQGLM